MVPTDNVLAYYSSAHEVQKSPDRGNDDVGPVADLADLVGYAHSPVDDDRLDVRASAELPALFVDLRHQFTGWPHDQSHRRWSQRTFFWSISKNPSQNGQQETSLVE